MCVTPGSGIYRNVHHWHSKAPHSQEALFVFPAYSKTVTLGKDEFHLHLVDTAGQVPVVVGCPNGIVQPYIKSGGVCVIRVGHSMKRKAFSGAGEMAQ